MSGMARWIVDVQKLLGGEYWTNVYNVTAPDIAGARTAALEIVGYERSVHASQISFDLLRIRPAILGAGNGLVEALGGTGQVAHGPTKLPLFCVVRVDFRTDQGRPSRKYLRIGFDAGALETGLTGRFAAAYVAVIQSTYADPLVAETYFVDVDNQPFTSAVVFPQVAMRQLRRGSKRKPIITP